MHSICKKYKGTITRMQALRDWTSYIHSNVPKANDDWDKILKNIDETRLDDDTFTQLFIDYSALGGVDIEKM